MEKAQYQKMLKGKCLNYDSLAEEEMEIEFEKLPSRSGWPTLRAIKNDKAVFVHSSYDPIREAQQWAEPISPKQGDVYFVFGYGLGYHVAELLKKMPDNCKLIIVEICHELILNAYESINAIDLLHRENVSILAGKRHLELEVFLAEVVGFNHLEKIQFLDYKPGVRLFQDDYDELKTKITNAVSNLIVEMNTILYFSEKWLHNLFANLPQTIMSPGIATLYGEFPETPAIIVSAGPSLNKNIHLLKDAKGKSVIICVGTALKPMIQAGIEPDLVISVDGGKPNFRHFQNIPAMDVPLVFDLTIYPEIPKTYSGPKLVGGCHENLLSWIEKTLEEKKGLYQMGPSVACMAFDVARNLGCNPTILIGQDLAYTDNQAHAKGTAFDHRTIENFRGREIIEVDGVFGTKVLTDRVMATFIRWFEIKINESRETHRVIDATEGGAKIPGTDIMPLSQVIREFCTDEVEADIKIARLIREYAPPEKDRLAEIKQNIENLKLQLGRLEKQAGKGVSASRKLLEFYEKRLSDSRAVNKLLRELDRTDRRIAELKESTELFTLMFQKSIIKMKHNLKSVKETEDTENGKGKRIALCSIELYAGINGAAGKAGKMVSGALVELENLLRQGE